ncbi:hypothetical protein RhiJN_24223 [Ceratobasidium sp. AG-Ba]|nr:hypothetical protein RhiJN_24223 [Ceratobasidium sp. AG-Ba]
MVCILGHKSGFPCAICLVPRLEQSKLGEQWPPRTVSSTIATLRRAENTGTKTEKESILQEQSLRDVRSAFIDIIPPIHSIYDAVVADPLHQIEQGVWGKHLWPWIRDDLPKASRKILDSRFQSIQRYPDLKHFPNGVTELEYITGKEHGVILRMIVPLISDLIQDKYRKLILGTFRSLAEIHILVKLTTHNDITLERLENEIKRFDGLHRQLSETFPTVGQNYPKLHFLSHIPNIIRRHSTTDNYHTGLGEAMHPQTKRDYRRSSKQKNFEIELLRMYQERETIMRIRARVDSANKRDDEDDKSSNNAWDGPRISLGAPDRRGRRLATAFVDQMNHAHPDAQGILRALQVFIYQKIGGFGNRIHFRLSDLPSLDSMLVYPYHLASIGYTSVVDSRDSLDLARSTNSWRKQGPRHDHVIADDGKELFVARLLELFDLKVRDRRYSLAYARLFRIKSRNKTTGYIELTDTRNQKFIFLEWIIRSCVLISATTHDLDYVLWDMEGADMYLRLQDL